jgi:hypothetical protein
MKIRKINIITPVYSDPEYNIKRKIINELCNNLNIIAILPEYDAINPKFDIKKSVQLVKESKFVIADLSLERPSCYYELGIAEALNKEIHIIAISGTEIHQTSYRRHVVFYKNIDEYEEVIQRILIQI